MTVSAPDSARALTPDALISLVYRYAARPERWPAAPRYDTARRWYARIGAGDGHEVWLLTWLPGQGTGLHDHGGSGGAMLVLRGALQERVLVRGAVPHVRPTMLGMNDGRGFGPHHVHDVVNVGTVPAVSLHVYSPALTAMTRYELSGGRLRTLAVERAGDDW